MIKIKLSIICLILELIALCFVVYFALKGFKLVGTDAWWINIKKWGISFLIWGILTICWFILSYMKI